MSDQYVLFTLKSIQRLLFFEPPVLDYGNKNRIPRNQNGLLEILFPEDFAILQDSETGAPLQAYQENRVKSAAFNGREDSMRERRIKIVRRILENDIYQKEGSSALINKVIDNCTAIFRKSVFDKAVFTKTVSSFLDNTAAYERDLLDPDYSRFDSDDLQRLQNYIRSLLQKGDYPAVLAWMALTALLRNEAGKLLPFTESDQAASPRQPSPVRPDTSRPFGPQSSTYVERTALLERISEALEEERIVYLCGFGGTGKSELAKAYAADRFNGRNIYYITYQPERSFAQALNDQHYDPKDWQKDDLLIVDNFNEDTAGIFRYDYLNDLLEAAKDIQVIITTRYNNLTGVPGTKISLEPSMLDPEDLAAFNREVFLRNCRRDEENDLTEEELACADKILKALNQHVLSAALSGCYLKEHPEVSLEEFHSRILNGIAAAFPDDTVEMIKDGKSRVLTVSDTFTVLFNDVLRYRFTEAEKKVLSLLYMLSYRSYSDEMIGLLLGDHDKIRITASAIRRLRAAGLLGSEEKRVSLHPLLGQVLFAQKMICSLSQIFLLMPHCMANFMAFCDPERMLRQEPGDEYHTVSFFCTFTGNQQLEEFEILPDLYWHFYSAFNQKTLAWIKKRGLKKPLFAIEDYPAGRRYLAYDLENGKITTLWNLSKQKEKSVLTLPENNRSAYQNALYALTDGIHEDPAEKPLSFRLNSLYIPYCEEPLVIPEEIDGFTIDTIPSMFCRDFTMMMGEDEDYDYTLRSGGLVLPDTITTIGKNAFCSTRDLRGTIRLPQSLQYVENLAFYNCGGSFEDLVLPEYMTSVGARAFSGTHIRHLVLNEGLESVGNHAFNENPELTGDLILPDSLTSLGGAAFSQCAFDGILHLGQKLETIPDYCFMENDFHGTLELPQSLRSIGRGAFALCRNFTDVIFQEGLQEIGEKAFYGAGTKEEVVLPSSLKRIGSEAFFYTKARRFVFACRDTDIEGEIVRDYAGMKTPVTFVVHHNSTAENYALRHSYRIEYLEENN